MYTHIHNYLISVSNNENALHLHLFPKLNLNSLLILNSLKHNSAFSLTVNI